jgi:hypothetical protein
MKVTYEGLIKSLQISLVVGTILVLINHSGVLRGERVTSSRLMQIVLCFIVPFAVSLYSQSVAAGQRQSDQGQPSGKNTPGS